MVPPLGLVHISHEPVKIHQSSFTIIFHSMRVNKSSNNQRQIYLKPRPPSIKTDASKLLKKRNKEKEFGNGRGTFYIMGIFIFPKLFDRFEPIWYRILSRFLMNKSYRNHAYFPYNALLNPIILFGQLVTLHQLVPGAKRIFSTKTQYNVFPQTAYIEYIEVHPSSRTYTDMSVNN